MTGKRPLKFGLLKGKVTVREDFDSPMTLARFLGAGPEMTSDGSGQAAPAETEKLRGPDEVPNRDD